MRALLDDVHFVRYAPQLGEYWDKVGTSPRARRRRCGGGREGAPAPAASSRSRSPGRPSPPPADDRFREANDLARAGDYPKAIALYGELAASGQESASLYWNWAQAATARGAQGEALWALLRARELDPGDRAVVRDVERLREALNLDPAEIAPEPLAAAGRFARRFRLDLVALALLALSAGRPRPRARPVGPPGGGPAWPGPAWSSASSPPPSRSPRPLRARPPRRPPGGPAPRRRLADGRADRLAPRGRGRARPRVERGVAAGRGQRRRPRLGPRGRRAAARRPARAAPRLTRLQTPYPRVGLEQLLWAEWLREELLAPRTPPPRGGSSSPGDQSVSRTPVRSRPGRELSPLVRRASATLRGVFAVSASRAKTGSCSATATLGHMAAEQTSYG